MGWKKNAFRYVIWFIYALMTDGILVILARNFCAAAGIEIYWGVLAVVLFFIGAGGVVFLAHRAAPFLSAVAGRNRRIFLLLEAITVVLLVAVGLVLRLSGMEEAGGESAYYDVAKVIEGQEISGMPHVASYLYVWMLHGVFVLLGNRIAAGIWIQVILQLAALLALYFAVRWLAGVGSALVFFGYCACAPYMVGKALVLSPEMLYFFFFAVTAVIMAGGYARKGKPGIFWLTGVLTALCCYLDVLGCLLLLLTCLLLVRPREEGAGGRLSAAGRYMAGVLLGLFTCAFLDSFLSGTTVWTTIRTWLLLYEPKGFRWFAIAEAQNLGMEVFVLSGLLAFGIFSFWCDRKRDDIAPGMLALCSLVLAGCHGVFTEEIPGFFYVYLLLVLQAGVGVGKAFRMPQQEEAGERYGWEALIEKMEENESRREAREREEASEEEKQVQYIENPLPLPKKHVKHILDYSIQQTAERDDFDYPVSGEDDFDI